MARPDVGGELDLDSFIRPGYEPTRHLHGIRPPRDTSEAEKELPSYVVVREQTDRVTDTIDAVLRDCGLTLDTEVIPQESQAV